MVFSPEMGERAAADMAEAGAEEYSPERFEQMLRVKVSGSSSIDTLKAKFEAGQGTVAVVVTKDFDMWIGHDAHSDIIHNDGVDYPDVALEGRFSLSKKEFILYFSHKEIPDLYAYDENEIFTKYFMNMTEAQLFGALSKKIISFFA